MPRFMDDYERRLRHLASVGPEVEVRADYVDYSYSEYTRDGCVDVEALLPYSPPDGLGRWSGTPEKTWVAKVSYTDIGAFIRALDEVPEVVIE